MSAKWGPPSSLAVKFAQIDLFKPSADLAADCADHSTTRNFSDNILSLIWTNINIINYHNFSENTLLGCSLKEK